PQHPPLPTLFPYTTLFRSQAEAPVEALANLAVVDHDGHRRDRQCAQRVADDQRQLGVVVLRQGVPVDDVDVRLEELAVAALLRTDRKSTRLNSSHQIISYA